MAFSVQIYEVDNKKQDAKATLPYFYFIAKDTKTLRRKVNFFVKSVIYYASRVFFITFALNYLTIMEENKKKKSLDFSVKAAWLAIAKMYNVVGATQGVTHSTGYVLLNIDKEKGTPATKIAPLMGMEARSLSRMLKSMEDDHLIYRQVDKKDKRKVFVCLTEKGRQKREFARQTVKEFNRKVKEELAPEQLLHFFEVIDKIIEIVEVQKMPLVLQEEELELV